MVEHGWPLEVVRRAQETARRLIVEDVPWLVYELPALPFDRRATSSLVFESENAIRRVRNYPPEWRELSDTDLWELSWSS